MAAEKPVVHIALVNFSAAEAAKINAVLKCAPCYCLPEAFSTSAELIRHRHSGFYWQDIVIVNIDNLFALFLLGKKIKCISHVYPNSKIVLQYKLKLPVFLFNKIFINAQAYAMINSRDTFAKQVDCFRQVISAECCCSVQPHYQARVHPG
jgi:hypothetical protein